MGNIKFSVDMETQEKILLKHGIGIDELMLALHDGKPKLRRWKGDIFIAITHYFRYITIFFEVHNQEGKVTTAYPSSPWQIAMYHKK